MKAGDGYGPRFIESFQVRGIDHAAGQKSLKQLKGKIQALITGRETKCQAETECWDYTVLVEKTHLS
jgi:hypothetical protein